MDPEVRAHRLIADAGPLLERLLTHVGAGVVVCDMQAPDEPMVYVNPSFERLTGYPAESMVGRNCRVLQGEGTDRAAVEEMRAALASGEAHAATLLNYRSDGSEFWNEIRLAPIRDEDGTLRFYLALLTDVTERLRAQNELAEAVARHSSVFNVLNEGLMVIDRDGTVLDVNPAALAILGVTREQLTGDWWSALDARYPDGSVVEPDTSPGTTAVREGRPVSGARFRVRRGDGAERLVVLNYEPLGGANLAGGFVISIRDITESQNQIETLQLFEAVVAISSDFVAVANLDNSVRYINQAGRALIGLDPDQPLDELQVEDFLTEEGRRSSREVEHPAVIADGYWEGTSTLRHFQTGAAIPVRISSYLVRHPETGVPWALATVQRDISEELEATADLVQSRERYEAQFRSLPLPAYVWQRQHDDFVLVEWNQAAEEVTNGGIESLRGASADELYADDLEMLLGFERCWSTRSPVTRELPYRMRSTGEDKHLIVTFAWVPSDLVLVHTLDITQRVESERQLLRVAEHDDLTGLFNRRYFEQQLEAALGVGSVAVIIVDIDHFKFVNDSFGHGLGDELLREVAETMARRLRDGDILARFGGDEFAVLAADVDESGARTAADHLLAAIRSHVTGVSVTASAGVAVFDPSAAVNVSDAIVAADIALYHAKESGRDRTALYAGQAGHSLTWLQKIRDAISEERLVLHGQPVLDLSGRLTNLYELLVRMVDEDGAVIPPTSFLPTAEQFGLIRDIDRWVIGRGIEFAARGHRVSINLSARSLADPELPGRIAAKLRETAVPPDHITFEFTETAAVSNVEDARTFTEALISMGCAAALDDFGTGFGTFMLLKHLPVRVLKIDMEFVRNLSTSSADQRIVRTIVQIAAEAGMLTAAEGVEDAGALALLREYGVNFAQGYHIGRPAPLPD